MRPCTNLINGGREVQVMKNDVNRDAKHLKLDTLRCGDFIFVHGQDSQGAAAKLAHSYGRKVGKKFSARSREKGVAIFRVG